MLAWSGDVVLLTHGTGKDFSKGLSEAINIPGLYVTGNASACGGTQLVIVAAALAEEDYERGRVNGPCEAE